MNNWPLNHLDKDLPLRFVRALKAMCVIGVKLREVC